MTLNLDARRRAMLDEIGVRVFLPASAPVQNELPATPIERASTQEPALAVRPSVSEPAPADGAERSPARPVLAQLAETGVNAARPDVAHLDWAGLQAAVSGCRACGLCESRRKTVFGVGGATAVTVAPPSIDWLIVGEAPGENEDLQGEPFVGQAGRLLDLMLVPLGLTRRPSGEPALRPSVYIVNVLKCRPPMNRNPEPGEIARCEPYLQRQIELLQPRIILAMGRFAIQTLLAPTVAGVQTAPVGALRGKVHEYRGIPVVATYHPSYLLRSPHEKAKAWADLCLAMDVFEGRA